MALLKKNITYTIRPMQDIDIPQAIELDHEAFPTQWPHPTYASLKQELRNRLAHYLVASKFENIDSGVTETTLERINLWDKFKRLFNQDGFPDIAPSSCKYVLGMIGFWLMMHEAHITTIAVRETYRRLGIGERLLISAIDSAIQINAHIVTLEVRTSNEQAQKLYKKYSFYKTGIRQRYYTDNGEDAFIMTTDMLTTSAFQSHFQHLKTIYQEKWNCSLESNCDMPLNKPFGGT